MQKNKTRELEDAICITDGVWGNALYSFLYDSFKFSCRLIFGWTCAWDGYL